MKLLQDPRELKSRIREEEAEWAVFFKTLRLSPPATLDHQIHTTSEFITKQTNCRTCSACCTHLEAGLSENEIHRLAALKNRNTEEFLAEETAQEYISGTVFLSKKPCIFLDKCDCSIYSDRPDGCRNFPGLDRPGIKYRLRRLMEHMEICPIIYNTFNFIRHKQQHQHDSIA